MKETALCEQFEQFGPLKYVSQNQNATRAYKQNEDTCYQYCCATFLPAAPVLLVKCGTNVRQ